MDETSTVARITDGARSSRDELRARGRSERKRVPRSAHAEWSAPPDRRDPLEILVESNATRAPELVPIRYQRMIESPFTYYRGSPAVMASDLATTPTTEIWPQICGDAHLSNFGMFGTPERALVFDVNDFDETLPGPFEWDLKRLATSFVVAARAYGLGKALGRKAVVESVRRYASVLVALASMTTLDVWYSRVESNDLMQIAESARLRRRLARSFRKARGRDSLTVYSKLASVMDDRHVIVDDPPLIVHPPTLDDEEAIRLFWSEYLTSISADRRHLLAQYDIHDVARKVVGVGSVGTQCYIALLIGRGQPDVLFLQVKEAQQSVLEPHLGRSEFDHHGERVVVGQRMMQSASDIFLGWASSVLGRQFYVRQLRDMKLSADVATLPDDGFVQYAGLCGATLARAHANTCDPALISGYVGLGGSLSQALTQFAETYAAQVEIDHAQLVAAAREGLVETAGAT